MGIYVWNLLRICGSAVDAVARDGESRYREEKGSDRLAVARLSMALSMWLVLFLGIFAGSYVLLIQMESYAGNEPRIGIAKTAMGACTQIAVFNYTQEKKQK